jgi:hypothetical protein
MFRVAHFFGVFRIGIGSQGERDGLFDEGGINRDFRQHFVKTLKPKQLPQNKMAIKVEIVAYR